MHTNGRETADTGQHRYLSPATNSTEKETVEGFLVGAFDETRENNDIAAGTVAVTASNRGCL